MTGCNKFLAKFGKTDPRDKLMSFGRECEQQVFEGYTMENAETCTTDDDCWSKSCTEKHSQMKCTALSGESAVDAIFDCWRRNASTEVWNAIGATIGFDANVVTPGVEDLTYAVFCPAPASASPSEKLYCAKERMKSATLMETCYDPNNPWETNDWCTVGTLDDGSGAGAQDITQAQCEAIRRVEGRDWRSYWAVEWVSDTRTGAAADAGWCKLQRDDFSNYGDGGFDEDQCSRDCHPENGCTTPCGWGSRFSHYDNDFAQTACATAVSLFEVLDSRRW